MADSMLLLDGLNNLPPDEQRQRIRMLMAVAGNALATNPQKLQAVPHSLAGKLAVEPWSKPPTLEQLIAYVLREVIIAHLAVSTRDTKSA
jgi:hypothetical protein